MRDLSSIAEGTEEPPLGESVSGRDLVCGAINSGRRLERGRDRPEGGWATEAAAPGPSRLCPVRLASLPSAQAWSLLLPGISLCNHCGPSSRPQALGAQLSAMLGHHHSGCWGHMWLSLPSDMG